MTKYLDEPLTLTAAGFEVPGESIRRTPGGNQDHWELFGEAGIIRRVHKIPRKFLFVPQDVTLPTGFTLGTLDQKSRRTVIYQKSGGQRILNDGWETMDRRQRPVG